MDDLFQKRVYVASPLRSSTAEGRAANVARARRLCLLAMAHDGVAAFAPHGFYTEFLDDSDSTERELGIRAGQTWLELADELWCWTKNGISDGMREEIALAEALEIPVVMNPPCFEGVDA